MNLEYYELSTLTSGEAMRLFDTLRCERGQVVSITRTASGGLVVVSPFDRDTTRRLLVELGEQIEGLLH